jgi:hypothetical protein
MIHCEPALLLFLPTERQTRIAANIFGVVLGLRKGEVIEKSKSEVDEL